MKTIDIFLVKISELSDSIGFLFNILCDSRIIKANKYSQRIDKVRCLIGGILILYAFKIKYNIIINNYEEITTKFGKPRIKDFPDFYFNISHSGDYVVLSSADFEVGIDIEKKDGSLINIMQSYLTNEEYNLISDLNQDQINHKLYEFWTIKESIMKATGLGFRLHPLQIQVQSFNPVKTYINNVASQYYTNLISISNEYSLSVSALEHFNYRLMTLSLSDICKVLNNN
ncbi:MAG: 4'-phosphopantetheinyl transferase superfamily protein [Candidatus Cloacimonetes bacterium]|jgi:4'-phosphopantetheinyl transferase|nr:4'-phosphopantetheinyl transferase superfamily protein [Candidatus Cloacimonadota bacterium]MDD4155755.1 4'-phosphopantetheinyl transferase superfamily protein [Candidatus Cloacimonadota bacterium]